MLHAAYGAQHKLCGHAAAKRQPHLCIWRHVCAAFKELVGDAQQDQQLVEYGAWPVVMLQFENNKLTHQRHRQGDLVCVGCQPMHAIMLRVMQGSS